MSAQDKLNCKQVSRILSDGLDRELPPTERARLRLHLAICEACREVEQQMGFLRRVLKRIGPDEPQEPPDKSR